MSYIHNNAIPFKMSTFKITNICPTQRPIILLRGQLGEDVQKIMSNEWTHTECCTNLCPQHSICQASFITCETSSCREFTVHFFPAVQLPLFHRRVSRHQPPTLRQASHIPKIFLDIQQNSWLAILMATLQIMSFSSSKECGFFHNFSSFVNSLYNGIELI